MRALVTPDLFALFFPSLKNILYRRTLLSYNVCIKHIVILVIYYKANIKKIFYFIIYHALVYFSLQNIYFCIYNLLDFKLKTNIF